MDGSNTTKFSSKDNCLDPGSKADLPELTQVEEMLIACVHPFMEVRQVRGAQCKYTGHIVNFLRETARVYAKLPLLPHDLDVRPANANTDGRLRRQFTRDFRVTRDMIFNEDEICDGNWDKFRDELLEADVQKITEFVQNHSMAEDEGMTEPDDEDVIEIDALPVTDMADVNGNQESEETDATQEDAGKQFLYITARFAPYPTPPQSPPSVLLAHTIQPMPFDEPIPKEEGDKTIPWQAASLTGLKAAPMTNVNGKILDKAKMKRLLRQGVKVHRNLLPAPPKWHQDLDVTTMQGAYGCHVGN
jgi:hypothetical protein